MTRSAALPPTRLVATLLAAALTSLLLLAVVPEPAPAAPPPERTAIQTDIFRECLDLLHFRPLKAFADLDPKDCILVMLGDTGRLTEIPGGLKAFLMQGGAALIASDEPMQEAPKAALIDATGYSITGYTWVSSPDLTLCYRGFPFCPQVVSADRRFMFHPQSGVPLFVATNMPSTLKQERAAAVPWFAQVPDGTVFRHPPPAISLSAVFGCAGDVGQGRVVVLADHSIFINEMMKPRDTGNVEFTANCLTYLRGNQGQRKRVLFVDEGVIQPSFKTGSRKPSPINTAAAFLNKLQDDVNREQDHLNEIDQRDGFNRSFMNFVHENPRLWRRATIITLVLATLGLLIYGCYRLGIAARHRTDFGVLLLGRATRQQAPRANLLALRQEDLLDADNVWEAGRQLARDAFEAGGVAAPTPYREPAVKVPNAGWWQRSLIQRRVLQLWRLAFRTRPMPLAPHALLALAAELEQLKADLKRGTIQVT